MQRSHKKLFCTTYHVPSPPLMRVQPIYWLYKCENEAKFGNSHGLLLI